MFSLQCWELNEDGSEYLPVRSNGTNDPNQFESMFYIYIGFINVMYMYM